MPFVTVRITDDKLSAEKKQEVIAGITDVLVKVLNKNPATTMVVIEEIPTDNWGIAGESVTVRRARAAQI